MSRIPLGRLGRMEEIAGAIVFLASPAASSSVRKVLQRHFRKFFSIDFISSGLWKCGKAERSWRGFSKPLWESASYADFHSGVISIRPLPFFLFWFFFLSLLLRSSLCEKLFALGSFMGHVHRVG